jgi:hypothetical protein
MLYGGNKKKSQSSIAKSATSQGRKAMTAGYGGHFRAVQGFEYIGFNKETSK